MDDSEPETEVWEEDEDNILHNASKEIDKFDSSTPFDTIPASSGFLAMWIVRFLMVMQAAFRLSDVVVGRFLQFFVAIFGIIGQTCKIGRDVCECLPQSLYKAKKMPGEVIFQRYVVCTKCFSLYTFSQSIEVSPNGTRQSKYCSFQRFPSHPQACMRSKCGTLLLKNVELASKKTYFYPFLTYCYLGLDVSIQSLLSRDSFFNDCENWRSRTVKVGEMQDVYDGQMWQNFITYKGEPSLSQPGNLGLILNFDFFQPFDHLTYYLGAIYLSILNLPRGCRYKQNTILIGLIPGPHEPRRNINTFLKPLVADLLKLWDGLDMKIGSLDYVEKIHCALLCISCDLPAGRKICGFLGHGARLGCSKCLKEFPGAVGTMDYSRFDRPSCKLKKSITEQHLRHMVLALWQLLNQLKAKVAVDTWS